MDNEIFVIQFSPESLVHKEGPLLSSPYNSVTVDATFHEEKKEKFIRSYICQSAEN